jgi:hypothetical protein
VAKEELSIYADALAAIEDWSIRLELDSCGNGKQEWAQEHERRGAEAYIERSLGGQRQGMMPS